MVDATKFTDTKKIADKRCATKIKHQKQVTKQNTAAKIAAIQNRYKGQESISNAGTHRKLSEW